jgi:hypothetical protein
MFAASLRDYKQYTVAMAAAQHDPGSLCENRLEIRQQQGHPDGEDRDTDAERGKDDAYRHQDHA